jgi:hypothetical protein
MLKKQTQLTLNHTDKFPIDSAPDILFICNTELPLGEIMPGIILFNAPADYIPIRVFVNCSDVLTNFVIQDSEQTEIFVAAEIQVGYTCLNLKNGFCPPFLPTLNLSCQGNNDPGLRVIIEYHRFPLL